ncbi:hypothetical protein A3C67_00070 [Candidatus Nomurabacteria bacterium RIFCSPHIGHO2_02_FULL_42_19]|uniref:Uncharacterized protein n=1 Tax=Candidatus Nomurabacteria bacterium RIFCSPHIGHO2_02_FULL_42_19 TaxID=1801756 RepID=A0A1F6W3G5_9BACT|nr:MAG: hypothetical protein A3C67_00070 [Candidatus Nomurabacteria bacterium RIFCSPHIGHO2_02_FULL_42_19]
MRAIAIKMKSYASTMGAMEEGMSKTVLHSLLLSLCILAVFYTFLLGNMVFNIIERKTLEAEMQTLATKVADLELEYLALSGKVDLAFSQALGFKEIKATFATRKTLGSIKVVKNEI